MSIPSDADPVVLSEKKEQKEEQEKSDFITALSNLIKKANWKLGLFIFFIGLIIFSNIFVEKWLSYIPNTSVGDNPTTKGTIIQLFILAFIAILIDLMVQYHVI